MKKPLKCMLLGLLPINLILIGYGETFAYTSRELNQAYQFAFENEIIAQTDIQNADMYSFLARSDMAEILVNYATKILGHVPNTGLSCQFDDITNEPSETKFSITLACQLGLMGRQSDGAVSEKFNPNEVVMRADLGTALSRLLYGDLFNGGTPYYIDHLSALKLASIISNTNPDIQEIRGNVLLMLMRAEKPVTNGEKLKIEFRLQHPFFQSLTQGQALVSEGELRMEN